MTETPGNRRMDKIRTALMWEKAFRDAERDALEATRGLQAIKHEMKAADKEFKRRREVLKADLADAIKAKKSAAYALKTGKEPK